MGSVGVLIDGDLATIPGVYPLVDASAMTPIKPGFSGLILVVGASDGGDPSRVYSFRNPDEAKATLKGGRTLRYISRMFNASPELPGASMVKFIRANQAATQGSIALGV
jgi:hypothetical protein